MARSANAGRISINLSAGTAQFVVDMEKANAKIKQLGDSASHSVSGVQATSAALRTLEGGVTNNLRAAENFIAKTLNLGEVLKHAFPVVGAIALGGVVFELVKKVGEAIDAFKKLQEAPRRVAQEFDALAQPIRVTNDELAVSNARLENEIAKLQGRPQNNLRLALAEAAVSADKLAESLNHAFESEQKLLESESLGAIKGFFTGKEPTADLAEQFKKFRDGLTEISLNANTALEKEADPTKRAAIYKEATNQRIAAIRTETEYLQKQLSVAEGIEKSRLAALKNPQYDSTPYGPVPRRGGAGDKASQELRISTLRGELEPLQAILAGMPLQAQNDALKKQKEGLETSAANSRLRSPVRDKLREEEVEAKGMEAEARAARTVDPTAANHPFTEALAKGAAEADKVITALTIHMESLKQVVTPAEASAITNFEKRKALAAAQKREADEWVRTQKEIIKGSEEISDKIRNEEIARQALLARMSEQIDEAQKLAAAEVAGSDAVFQAQLKIKLAKIADPDVQAKTQSLDEAEHAGAIAQTVAQLDRETAATKRLQDALRGGDEARRRAELANIAASGESPDVIAAQQRAKRAQYELEDATQLKNMPASAGVHAYFQQMVDEAQSSAMQVKNIMSSAFEGINDNLARLVSGQKVSWSNLFQSLSADIAKMAIQNAEVNVIKKIGIGGNSDEQSPWNEKIPGSASNSGGVLGKIGGIFGLGGKVAAKRDGSSASAALYVQFVGSDSSSSPALPGLFGGGSKSDSDNSDDDKGNLFQSLFGGGSKDGSNDSSNGAGSLFKNLFGGGSGNQDGGGNPLQNLLGGGDGGDGGGGGGFWQNLFGGFRANGGSVDPGQAYIVGEQGPELFRPPSSGSIVPNHQLGGTTIHYTIDARGTDPVLTEQRTKAAILAAHNSSVGVAQQVSQERARRAPQQK